MSDVTPYVAPDGVSGTEWSALASYSQQFTPNFGASIDGQYFNDLYIEGTDEGSGLSAWQAELSPVWTSVTNFEARAEAFHLKVEDFDGVNGGFLRFTRFF